MTTKWDGKLVRRRYAIFDDLIYGKYAIVVREADIERAPNWGGFVAWLGGEHKPESRGNR
jgi:hypothetical protein